MQTKPPPPPPPTPEAGAQLNTPSVPRIPDIRSGGQPDLQWGPASAAKGAVQGAKAGGAQQEAVCSPAGQQLTGTLPLTYHSRAAKHACARVCLSMANSTCARCVSQPHQHQTHGPAGSLLQRSHTTSALREPSAMPKGHAKQAKRDAANVAAPADLPGLAPCSLFKPLLWWWRRRGCSNV